MYTYIYIHIFIYIYIYSYACTTIRPRSPRGSSASPASTLACRSRENSAQVRQPWIYSGRGIDPRLLRLPGFVKLSTAQAWGPFQNGEASHIILYPYNNKKLPICVSLRGSEPAKWRDSSVAYRVPGSGLRDLGSGCRVRGPSRI